MNNDTSCPITYTLYVNGPIYSGPTGAISYNSGTKTITLYSTSVLHKGISNVRFFGTNTIVTSYVDFMVDITVDHCYYAVIASQTISSIIYTINDTMVS